MLKPAMPMPPTAGLGPNRAAGMPQPYNPWETAAGAMQQFGQPTTPIPSQGMPQGGLGGSPAVGTSTPDPLRGMQMNPISDGASSGYEHGGLVDHASGGRDDAVETDVPENTFIVPADVLAALGDGNTMKGAALLDQELGISKDAPRGGLGNKPVPVQLSGGEYRIPPDKVAMIGGGDMQKGVAMLTQAVQQIRAREVKRIAGLPKPKQ